MRPIDADALVAYLQKMAETYHLMEKEAPEEFKSAIYNKFSAVMEVLLHIKRNVPTLDYAPVKHGHFDFSNGWDATAYACFGECSECKKMVALFTHKNFCPNCGAKMDGGKENV